MRWKLTIIIGYRLYWSLDWIDSNWGFCDISWNEWIVGCRRVRPRDEDEDADDVDEESGRYMYGRCGREMRHLVTFEAHRASWLSTFDAPPCLYFPIVHPPPLPPPTADNGPLKKVESLKTHCGVNKMLVRDRGCESSWRPRWVPSEMCHW